MMRGVKEESEIRTIRKRLKPFKRNLKN